MFRLRVAKGTVRKNLSDKHTYTSPATHHDGVRGPRRHAPGLTSHPPVLSFISLKTTADALQHVQNVVKNAREKAAQYQRSRSLPNYWDEDLLQTMRRGICVRDRKACLSLVAG